MRKLMILLAIGGLVLLNSCIYSLFPVYTDDTIVFYPELLGKWSGGDGMYLLFEEAGKEDEKEDTRKSYKFTVMDEEKVEDVLHVHLAKIGEDIFIDMYPWTGEGDVPYSVNDHFFPVHTFMKLEFKSKDELSMTTFKYSKLKELFESNMVRIKHEVVDDNFLLTAKTRDLQKFIDQYSDDESVFDDPDTYIRE